jgi:superfamily II DNA helicase RecQ
MESIVLSALRIMFLRGYRNSSMGFIADSITANQIQGFEPARTTPKCPIEDDYQVPPDLESDSVLPEDDEDFWTYNREQIASSANTDERFAALRLWRSNKARELGWSPNYVFSNKDLIAIVEANPKTINELAVVSGVGPKKLSDYGASILDALASKV